MIKKITAAEFLKQIDPSIVPEVRQKVKKYGSTALAFFQNVDMSSSQLGKSNVMPLGPNNTYKTPEELSFPDGSPKHLFDLPSQRQYAQNWCDADEFLKATEKM